MLTLALASAAGCWRLIFAFDAPFSDITISIAQLDAGREALEERHTGSRNILTAAL
jgi:hypothetical protein